MPKIYSSLRAHTIRVIVFSLLVALLLLGSGLWFFNRTGSHPTNQVLVTAPTGVTLFDRNTGKQIWQHKTGMSNFTPLIANNLIYVLANTPVGYATARTDALEALSLTTGSLQWSWSWKKNLVLGNPPVLADGVVYLSESTLPADIETAPTSFSTYQGFIVALRASDGQQLWKVSIAGPLSTATVANGVLYASDGQEVLALSTQDGHRLWQYQPANGDLSYYNQPDPLVKQTSVIIVQDRVYLQIRRIEGASGVYDLVALDPQTGKLLWRYLNHGGLLTPILENNNIYLASQAIGAPQVVELNATTGSVVWTYQDGPLYPIQTLFADGVLYVNERGIDAATESMSNVVTLQATSGHVLKRYRPQQGEMVGFATVSQQTLYVIVDLPGSAANSSAAVIALNLATGAEIWSSAAFLHTRDISAIIASGNQLYVFPAWSSIPATLYVLQADSGKQIWNYPTQDWMYTVVTDV